MHKDLIGKTFGRWDVIMRLDNDKYGNLIWLCRCSCGVEKKVYGSHLTSGKTKSCGCYAIERTSCVNKKHGLTRTRPYIIWSNMVSRCNNKNNSYYKDYGGRGITVCDRWKESFENFWEDMKEGYRDGLSIDRIDNNGNYSSNNCHWTTTIEQARNKRNNRLITYEGETLCLIEWAERLGINRATIWWRINSGWSIERTFTTK